MRHKGEIVMFIERLETGFETMNWADGVDPSKRQVLYEIAMLLRNTLRARGQEAVDFLLNDLLPKLNCPPEIANQLVQHLRTQQAKDFRKTFADFIKAMKA